MKKTYYNGKQVIWNELGVKALNVRSGLLESVSRIPDNKYIKAQVVESFDNEFFNSEEVPTSASHYAVRKGKKRDFILINGNKVVGYATLHRKDRTFKVDLEVVHTESVIVKAKNEAEARAKAELEFCSDIQDPAVLSVEATDVEVLPL